MSEIAPPIKPPEQPPASTIKAPESPGKAPKDVARQKAARGTLEQIANGTPVLEATAAPATEALPSREATQALLAEANSILLELKDMRLLVNAIATQAADTPLGNELQTDALRAILNMETETIPPESAAQLIQLQEKIKALNLPPAIPEASALIPVIDAYNAMHPDKPLPADIVTGIRKGDRAIAPAVAQMLQTNNDLAALTWKEITGIDGFTKLSPSPAVVLDLSGIPKTPENMKKATDMFAELKKMNKPPNDFADKAIMGIVYGATGLQAFIQIAMPEASQGGGGGH